MTEPVRKLGRYELLRRIAKGGMGEIYLARTRGAAGFEKLCIIKTILPHLAEEEEFVTKFLDEGRIVVQLVHGNIVPVFDMGQEGDEYFIAMEYIPGRDLREVVKKTQVLGTAIPVDLALFITSEVCKGLDYAHRKTGSSGEPLGIVHRDVSPSNVLISSEGEIKIIDFGIARAAGRASKTVSGRLQGKFCYMSPEQASGKPLDGRSDTFSTGSVLYELLTGFRPFEGDSDLESLDLVRRCEFDAPSTLNPAVPEEVDAIVERALARDPDQRYPSIDKLQIAILQYLYSTGTSPTPNELAGFLAGLFPDGLEREDLRGARGAAAGKKMSLDEALDFELGLLEGDADVNPHETTAISSDVADSAPVLGPLVSEPSGTPTGPTARAKPDPAIAQKSSARGRAMAAAAVSALLLAAGIAFGISTPSTGTLNIASDPAGAQIIVDGATVLGVETPHSLELEVGRHTLRLEHEGFEPRELTVDVREGTQSIDGEAGALQPAGVTGPRELRVIATPADAVLRADGTPFGTGTGATLLIRPNQSIRITAARPGCETLGYLVSHSYAEETLSLELANCVDPNSVDAGEVEDDASIEQDSVERVAVQVRRPRPRKPKNPTKPEVEQEMGCLNLRLDYPVKANIAIDGAWLPGEREWRLANHPLPPGKHKVRVKNDAVGVDETLEVEINPGRVCASRFFRSSQ